MVDEAFDALRERKRMLRRQRLDEAEASLPDIWKLLPTHFVVQNPSDGVFQIRRGFGRVLVQWWPSRKKWWEPREQVHHRGDLEEFKLWLMHKRWDDG